MKLSHRFACATLVASLLLAACGGGGDGSTTGATGATGAAGAPGANGLQTLLALTAEPAGANCPAAGTRVSSGLDTNGNDVLDSAEILQTVYVCDGATGGTGTTGAAGADGAAGAPGLISLVTTLAEPPGAQCATGGTRVQGGVDDNANGTLDQTEVDATAYICNGAVSAREWTVAANVDDRSSGTSTAPQVGAAADGSLMVAWYRSTAAGYQLWARRYTPASGWGLAVAVSGELDDLGIDTPQLAVDAAGNALLAWVAYDGINFRIWGNRFTVGSGWGVPARLDDASGQGLMPRLGGNAAGQAALVFHGGSGIWAAHYVPGTGWMPATRLATISTGFPAVAAAVDGSGMARVLWADIYAPEEVIVESHSQVGGTWNAPTVIARGAARMRHDLNLATNAAGDMVATWIGFDLRPRAVRYTPAPGTGWGSVASLDTTSVVDTLRVAPGVAVDPNGNAVVAWQRSVSDARFIFANHSTATGGWAGPVSVEGSQPLGSAPNRQRIPIQADASGNFVMAWVRGPGGTVWTNRYTPGSGWGEPGMLETASTIALAPDLAIDANGIVSAVWTLYDERFGTVDQALATSDIRYSRHR